MTLSSIEALNELTPVNCEQLCIDGSSPPSDEIARKSIPVVLSDDCKSLFEDEEYIYHGTSWLHAATIAQVGIQLESGRKLSDFGPQCFYMSRSLNSAIEWAHKIGGNEAAIVVYRSEWISTVEQLHVFDGPTDEWKETVHGFLNDKTMSIFKDKYS